jgi:hypothetical protein
MKNLYEVTETRVVIETYTYELYAESPETALAKIQENTSIPVDYNAEEMDNPQYTVKELENDY